MVRASSFSKLCVLREDLPVAPAIEVFLHHHLDRLRLVVAQLHFDLFFHPLAPWCRRVKIDLAALADHVERRAQLHAHLLVLRRVVDLVLADELEAAVGLVELRHAHAARGQRHAESELLVVLELEVDVHLLVHLDAHVAVGVRARSRRTAAPRRSRAASSSPGSVSPGRRARSAWWSCWAAWWGGPACTGGTRRNPSARSPAASAAAAAAFISTSRRMRCPSPAARDSRRRR